MSIHLAAYHRPEKTREARRSLRVIDADVDWHYLSIRDSQTACRMVSLRTRLYQCLVKSVNIVLRVIVSAVHLVVYSLLTIMHCGTSDTRSRDVYTLANSFVFRMNT